jgi:hypothetical protein
MHAKETQADWTEAEGTAEYLVYRHVDDELTLGANDLVARFVCTGDTEGNEAGTRTGVVVHFNPIVFREA